VGDAWCNNQDTFKLIGEAVLIHLHATVLSPSPQIGMWSEFAFGLLVRRKSAASSTMMHMARTARYPVVADLGYR
jgi:hypothetical protein